MLNKVFFGNAFSSAAQTVVSGLVLFLIYKNMIQLLGPELLGVWTVVFASVSFSRLSDFGFSGALTKFVANDKEDLFLVKRHVETAFVSVFVVVIAVGVGVYKLAPVLMSWAVESEMTEIVSEMVPWAIVVLGVNSMNALYQSSLDGINKIYLRNLILLIGNFAYLGLSLILAKKIGLMGLVYAQVLQSFLLLMMFYFALRFNGLGISILTPRWSNESFKMMFSYGLNFQLSSIVVLLMDPLTKLLMSRFAGVGVVAYYDMASQLVIKLRAILVSAYQAIVPTVAGNKNIGRDDISGFYNKIYRANFFTVTLFYVAIGLALPIVSYHWLGRVQEEFVEFAIIITASYAINTLNVPAYFINQGVGDVRINAISHVISAVANVLISYFLGAIYGAIGVVFGASLALVIGSVFVLLVANNKFCYGFEGVLPKKGGGFLFLVFILLLVNFNIGKNLSAVSYWCYINYIFSVIVVFGLAFVFHGDKKLLAIVRRF